MRFHFTATGCSICWTLDYNNHRCFKIWSSVGFEVLMVVIMNIIVSGTECLLEW